MHPFVNNKTTTSRHCHGAAVAAADLTEPPPYGGGLGDNNNQRTRLFLFECYQPRNAPLNGGVGYDDDGDGEVAVMVVLAAVEQQPERRGREKPRVKESDMGDRIDPLMRSIFGVRQKNPPKKFFDGRRWWPAAAGARRK
ncbi:hypothetical protein Tco_0299466 [Tanacetum coccineum]